MQIISRMLDVTSGHLTNDENRELWEAIRRVHIKNQIIAMGVVKLYLSDAAQGEFNKE